MTRTHRGIASCATIPFRVNNNMHCVNNEYEGHANMFECVINIIKRQANMFECIINNNINISL